MRRTIEKRKGRKGITLIALVVTIVVILILAGITVGMVRSDNGILKETKNAKEQAEIDNEKSIVERAKMLAMMRSKDGAITYEIFEPALKDEAGKTAIDVSDAGDTIEVLFTDSNRYYEIDQDGNVSKPQKVVKDEFAGDITKGGRCDGSEEKPYEISCVEDLVILANRTNRKGNYIDENGNIKDVVAENCPFEDKNFILTRTLNFESKYSYSKPELRWSYDSENEFYKIDDTSTTTLQEIITDKNGVGFIPIGPDTGSSPLMFWGNLDGKNYSIRNLYENRTDSNAGFFGAICGSVIKNLKISGNIIAPRIGTFAFISSGAKYYNCINLVNCKAKQIGGLTSEVYGSITMINCYNKANISKVNKGGGLMTWDDVGGTTTIVNCYNISEIETKNEASYDYASGIIGNSYSSGTRQIINTCSLGKINQYGNNFYKAYGGSVVSLENCFYPKSMVANNDKAVINEGSIAFDDSTVQEVVNTLNKYVKEHKNDYEVPLKEWKIETINGEKVPVLVD